LSASSERVALIDEKENYRGIFDHLVEGIFRTTPDGHYLLATWRWRGFTATTRRRN
jgi:PAS domain-containing protein